MTDPHHIIAALSAWLDQLRAAASNVERLIADLTRDAAHTRLVAAQGCRVPGCPACDPRCEWREKPLHPDRDCRPADVGNAEVLPAAIPGLAFTAPDRTEES